VTAAAREQPHDLIDETIHQRTRLAIMATLAGVGSLGFLELKARLDLTDGNLSVHLSALERAGYVRIDKAFQGKKPVTTVVMTAKGRTALAKYVTLLQNILKSAE
jgi:DNA-binding transcriptional ArsR family regulator